MITLDSPRDSDTHTLTDFAELLCLITEGRTCSKSYLADFIKDQSEKIVDVNILDDAYLQAKWRVAAFGDNYPFEISGDETTISATEDLTDKQKLYSLLLMCANLPFVAQKGGGRQRLGEAFERIALCGLQSIWPDAQAKAFGKNETDYTGEKWERLNKLAHDIGGRGFLTAGSYRARDTGDGGVDLAAWLDLDAYEKWNIPAWLAQCACSREEWPTKQSAVSHGRLRQHLNPTYPWIESIFIPQCFRNNHGKWAYEGELGALAVDRLRLIGRIDVGASWGFINAPDDFNQMLSQRLDLV